LKLYFDGWLALPSAALQNLGVKPGDVLEAELAENGTILLRPAAKGASGEQQQVLPNQATPHEPETMPEVLDKLSFPTRRKPGRPRKLAATEALQPAAAMGGPQGRLPQPELPSGQQPTPAADVRPQSELRRKVALPPSFLDHAPARGRRAERLSASTGYEREERRPFPHVEVRKLGPGRGHNKAHKLAS
jgi:antitoxin component of MazEF toxin-antitoxin module